MLGVCAVHVPVYVLGWALGCGQRCSRLMKHLARCQRCSCLSEHLAKARGARVRRSGVEDTGAREAGMERMRAFLIHHNTKHNTNN